MDTSEKSNIQQLLDSLNAANKNSMDTITLSGPESGFAGATGTMDYDFNSLTFNGSDTITLGSTTLSTGTSGSYIYTTGHDWASGPSTITQSGRMTLTGERADIEINGISLMETLKAIQERLNVLTPNPEIEAEWEELRVLGEQYRALEKKCKEKIDVWNKLKQMPPPPEL